MPLTQPGPSDWRPSTRASVSSSPARTAQRRSGPSHLETERTVAQRSLAPAAECHGTPALRAGAEACVEATLIDGLVLARSAFHHSINYRSAILYGTLRAACDPERALEKFTEKLIPGRWAHVRRPNPKELKATAVLAMPIEEGSAKLRSGPPVDDDEDYAVDTSAGVVPLRTVAGDPQPDPRLAVGVDTPPHVISLTPGR
jgi:uncharacterized protein